MLYQPQPPSHGGFCRGGSPSTFLFSSWVKVWWFTSKIHFFRSFAELAACFELVSCCMIKFLPVRFDAFACNCQTTHFCHFAASFVLLLFFLHTLAPSWIFDTITKQRVVSWSLASVFRLKSSKLWVVMCSLLLCGDCCLYYWALT